MTPYTPKTSAEMRSTMGSWQPIETVLTEAPRNGYCNLLLINAKGTTSLGNVHYVSHEVGWILQTSHGLHKPTHWIEIVPPPQGETTRRLKGEIKRLKDDHDNRWSQALATSHGV